MDPEARAGLSLRTIAPKIVTDLRIPCFAALLLLGGFAVPASAQSLGCLVTPSNVIELGSPSIGVIDKLYVDRGDIVREGQLLAKLRRDVERATVGLAKTRAGAEAELQSSSKAYDHAQRKLERAQDLFGKEFVSAQAVDQAVAEAQAAEARKAQAKEQAQQSKKELEIARAQLDTRTVRSPVSGVVVDVYRRSGERVEDRPIMKIATLNPLHVEIVMPAALYGRVKPGMPVSVQPDLAGQKALTGTVHMADRVIDPASNTFRVRVVLPNPDSAIPAGLRCQAQVANLATATASATATPTATASVANRNTLP
jgi:RND family efflux transporter MFP subunit